MTQETKPSKRKRGQPTKYRPAFHPKSYIELSSKGWSRAQICAEWDIDADTMLEWKKRHPEFSGACKKGDQKRQAWFTKFGMAMAAGSIKGGNVTAFIWMSKQVCGWSDKISMDVSEDVDVTFSDGEAA